MLNDDILRRSFLKVVGSAGVYVLYKVIPAAPNPASCGAEGDTQPCWYEAVRHLTKKWDGEGTDERA